MSVARALVVLVVLAVVAAAVVHLRGRSARVAYEIQELDARRVELKQALWKQQMEMARLWTPNLIRARLQPPEQPSPGSAP